MSGMEAIERLRRRGLGQVPAVLMTASREDAAQARAAGITCLDKPFALDDLLACVAHFVSFQQTFTAQTA
jgi:CheY-like chemotaxis protein